MITGILLQIMQLLLAIFAAPLLLGWVNQCRAWMQGRSAPSLLLPYRNIVKLFQKDAVIARTASPLFRFAPYMVFACMALSVSLVPILINDLPFSMAADAIALVGVFALARVFLALAAMDIGTAFGSLGARREMLVSFLAEPALLMVLFTASMISQSTQLPVIVDTLAHQQFTVYPSMAFAAIAFWMVSTAENARIPVDNPTTHLELTMIHEAMILEYSARHLALIEWAVALKLLTYSAIGIALFVPWGIATAGDLQALPLALGVFTVKMMAGGATLAFLESITAKLRLFQVPEYLGMAFLLAVLGMLIHFLLEA